MTQTQKLRRTRSIALAAVVVAAVAASSTPARAATPYVDIGDPAGPLTTVAIGNELSCQVKHRSDTVFEFFPSSVVPGDCGTFLEVGGTLYAPDFDEHGSTATGALGDYTPYTRISQSSRSGSGTRSNPYRVTTVVAAGTTGMQITQVDTYVRGEESYRTDVTVRNTSPTRQNAVLYRAGDCYLQNTDNGYGFVETARKAVGCSENPNNSPRGRIEQWVPITGGNNYYEARYSEVWAAIGAGTPFNDTCSRCTEQIDNGAGISWTISVPAAGTLTRSHFTTFSPTGRTGPPAQQRPTVRISGVPARCTRSNFRARVRVTSSSNVQTTVTVDGRVVKRTRDRDFRVTIAARRARPGRHTIRARATNSAGSRSDTSVFRRCASVQPRFTG